MGTYKYIDHAADVGIALEAPSLPDLFATAARALMNWMGPAPDIPEFRFEKVSLEAEDLSELLVRWLQEILYLFHSRHSYWINVDVIEITEQKIDATLYGSAWHELPNPSFQEIKAVTYHQARVVQREGIWCAMVILDI